MTYRGDVGARVPSSTAPSLLHLQEKSGVESLQRLWARLERPIWERWV